jgi:hypothetical protein
MHQRLGRYARVSVFACLLALAAAGAQAQPAPGLRAPDIAAGQWINSAPLSIEGLRGRVVLVEFWTFG